MIEPTTIGDLLLAEARRWPQSELLVLGEQRVSYLEMADRVVEKARAL